MHKSFVTGLLVSCWKLRGHQHHTVMSVSSPSVSRIRRKIGLLPIKLTVFSCNDGACRVQTAAATGRIASNNPNLQAIPKTPFSLVMFPEAGDDGNYLFFYS